MGVAFILSAKCPKIQLMKIKNEKKQRFELSDFYLAVFLRANNFQLLETIKDDPRRVLFVFEDTKNRQNLVEDFLFGRAKIEPKSFVAAIKELKQLLHSDL